MFYHDLLMNFFQEIGEEKGIVFQKNLPAIEPVYGELKNPLHWRLEEILKKGNLTHFYSHQVDAINAIREGKHIIISTRTASGKSLCYNLPVIESIMNNTSNKALYIFPSKALAQNQSGRLEKYNYAFYYGDFNYGIYDGDTPGEIRRKLRKYASIIITTPDMLHLGILPNHEKWKHFFQNLKFVVIDELHTYRGIFGSNMAHVLRRFRRICRHYGSNPQFICCSATIANPVELAKKLTLLDFDLIGESGAPSGEKTFLFWEPAQEEGPGRSINTEASLLLYHLISSNVRTIVFTRTRVQSEIIMKTTQDLLSGSHSSLVDRITSYRAGYVPEFRRRIERKLISGEILGVVSTSALEVGVDIGSLDACVIVGFPGSIMSVWQEAGRVGRRTGSSIVVIISSNSPHDQYYLHNGNDFFNSTYETCIIDTDNPYIADGHLRCASYELPLSEKDEYYFGSSLLPFIRAYSEKNYLFYKDHKFHWNIDNYYPAENFHLRSSSDENYEIVNNSPPCNTLGYIYKRNVSFYFHPHAIYIHQGETFRVLEMDERKKKIYVVADEVGYYTKPQIITEVSPIKENSSEDIHTGKLRIKETCTSYRQIELLTGMYLKTIPLNLEGSVMETTGFWFTLSDSIQKTLRNAGLEISGGLHGTGHIISFIIPVFTLCDTGDIGTAINPFHPATGKPTVFIYDKYPGGIGYALKGAVLFPLIVSQAFDLVMRCKCENGCFKCIYSSASPYPENYMNKTATLFILEGLKKNLRMAVK